MRNQKIKPSRQEPDQKLHSNHRSSHDQPLHYLWPCNRPPTYPSTLAGLLSILSPSPTSPPPSAKTILPNNLTITPLIHILGWSLDPSLFLADTVGCSWAAFPSLLDSPEEPASRSPASRSPAFRPGHWLSHLSHELPSLRPLYTYSFPLPEHRPTQTGLNSPSRTLP